MNVSFLAAGKATDDIKSNDPNIFPDIVFLDTTEKIVLDDQWRRFEITLNNVPLMHSTYPFGFQITENTSNAKQIFYLKGVLLTLDY